MKIGIVIRRFHTRGGTERRTRELVRWLLDAGHEVHLFAEAWDNELTDGISSHRIRTVKLARWLKALSFAVLAAQATRKWNLDLVHSQARTYADDVATLGGGCHADYLDHFLEDAPPLQRIWERNHAFNRVTMALEKAQYRRCSRLILNSSFAMRGLLRYFPDARAKCRVVHNGVDSEFFRPDIELRKKMRATLAVPEGALIFLFAGSGFARKGLAEFLRAFALTQQSRPGCHMLGLVVGHGNLPFYRTLAGDLDIDQHIIFGGAAADTRPFYCASDVFVLPTKFDPFANTTNEALASGLPVITTHTNGASEILTPKEGYVVERSTDIEELSAAMRALLDKERCATMSANARQTALLHPWSQTANKTLEVYEEILRERQTSHD